MEQQFPEIFEEKTEWEMEQPARSCGTYGYEGSGEYRNLDGCGE